MSSEDFGLDYVTRKSYRKCPEHHLRSYHLNTKRTPTPGYILGPITSYREVLTYKCENGHLFKIDKGIKEEKLI